MLSTFFDGSVEQAVASLLDLKQKDLAEEDLDKLFDLIEKSRRKER